MTFTAMLKPLRNRNFAFLLTGEALSHWGDQFLIVALPLIMLEKTGSLLAAGLVFAINTLPWIFIAPVSGVISDRFDRKRLMIIVNVLQGLAIAAIPFTNSVYLMYGLVALSSTLSTLDNPTREALIPEYLKGDDLKAGLSLQGVLIRTLSMVGPASAGVVVAFVGSSTALWLDALSFLAAGLMALPVFVPSVPKKDRVPLRILKDLAEGFRTVGRNRSLVGIMLSGVGVSIISGSMPVLVLHIVKQAQWGDAAYGYAMVALALGGLVGTLAAARTKLTKTFLPVVYLIPVVLSVISFITAGITSGLVILGILAAVKLITGFWSIVCALGIGKLVAFEVRARVSALRTSTLMTGTVIGSLLSGSLADATNSSVFALMGLIVLVSSAIPLTIIYSRSKLTTEIAELDASLGS